MVNLVDGGERHNVDTVDKLYCLSMHPKTGSFSSEKIAWLHTAVHDDSSISTPAYRVVQEKL